MSESPISNYLAYLVAQAHRRLHVDLQRSLQEEGAQVEQWRVLDVLSDGRGRSMGDLADLVLMNHPTLTKMTDRMVAKGLVHRAPDEEDQRRVLVYITDLGLELYERIKSRVDTQNSALEDHLGEREAAALRQLLERVIAREG
jgi:DNA-binding MarR family transcriptional regulator